MSTNATHDHVRYDFTGHTALVTGAASGLGRATAERFADSGAAVGLLDTDADDLRAFAEELRGRGATAAELPADVTDAAAVESACRTLADETGRIDVVYANAGINGVWAPLDELEPEEWDRTLAVNLRGTFLTVKYALPYLVKNDRGGAVVVCSSVNGTRIFSNSGATAYACSKAAQLAFVRMTALELAPKKVRVNALIPGAILTPIFDKTIERDLDEARVPVEYPAGKIPLTGGEPGDPADIAATVLFLCSDAAAHVTGAEVVVDGAESLLMG